jgi:hypothetical protein
VLLKVSDVLKEHVGRLVLLQNCDYVVEQGPSCVELAILESRLRKWLTRKTSAEDVMWRDLMAVSSNITNDIVRCARKVSTVQPTQLLIDFGREDALVPKSFEREVEAAQPREEIDEFQTCPTDPFRWTERACCRG